MKDEIKEINIKRPGQILDYVDTKEHLLELYKYITNLQEENERLKDYLDIFKLSNKTKQETIDDFRKRIDKAVEYIKSIIWEDKSMRAKYKMVLINSEVLLNILNGGNE